MSHLKFYVLTELLNMIIISTLVPLNIGIGKYSPGMPMRRGAVVVSVESRVIRTCGKYVVVVTLIYSMPHIHG